MGTQAAGGRKGAAMSKFGPGSGIDYALGERTPVMRNAAITAPDAPKRRKRRGIFAKIKALSQRVWPAYDSKHWKPRQQVKIANAAARQFIATGADPQFRPVYPHPLRAGWYMLEVRLRLPSIFSNTKLYPNMGDGESDATAFCLRVRTERLSKRLIYISKAATVRFDPLEAMGAFEIQHLRLVRVTESFAAERMRQKLAAKHPAYGSKARQQANASSNEKVNSNGVAQIWDDYNKVFKTDSGLVSYAQWIEHVEVPNLPGTASQSIAMAAWSWKPRFSIITPVYNTDERALRACLDSVLAQTYPHWEICIADDASSEPHIRNILTEYSDRDARIKVTFRSENGHIVEASNTALSLATGEFVVLLDHDDLLASHALYSVAEALQQRPTAQLVYSDEDKLDATGQRCDPYFKPDYSPDLLYSQNYFSHLGVYRRELVHAVGGFRKGYEGSQDYDLVLRCLARLTDLRDVLHIPQVLYHWRMAEGSTAGGHEQKPYATEAARKALQDHFDRQSLKVTVDVTAPGIYRHRRHVPEPAPLVSLIVPTRDGYEVLRTCIDSIVKHTTYANYEILIVDNQSTCAQTLAYLEELSAVSIARVLRFDRPFNYSAINNFAVRHAEGSILALVNNDVEVISGDWLTEMVSHAIRPDIGCVGAKLYYPNDTVQHGGVVCGMGGVANHSHRHFPRHSPGYFGRLWVIHNVSAVTGATLVLRKELYDAVGGLDEEGLPVAFNDVDLCLKVMALGYRNLWTPFAELYHHESVSRGADETPEKQARFRRECEVMQQRWRPALARDPYYNPNLSLHREDFSLGISLSHSDA
jgi:glycosyltransferase involved in cell wall biosynthesis